MNNQYFKELFEIIKARKLSKDGINKIKMELCKKYRLKNIPTDIQVLIRASSKDLPKLKMLQTKPSRSISGVTPIAIMTKPSKCPHGKCIYCPGGIGSAFGNVPQSYTGKEPATMRGIRADYDPYIQVMNRLEQYIVLGHAPEKVELIIMGGTFPAASLNYQKEFVKYALKAMNDFSALFFKKDNIDIVKFKDFFELPGDVEDKKRTKRIHKKLKKIKGKCILEKEQKKNETSKIRCVGMTIETRADYAKLKQANEMLRLGCTRVELGMQSIYDNVLKKIERGHTVKETIDAIKTLKDLGFKINLHYMLGLPLTTKEMDINALRRLFTNQDFQPDMLKIYPCMVLKGTKLYDEWKKGNYTPLTTQEAAEIIAEFKRIVPKYVRIMRVQRDIPTYATAAGVDRTNLRQYVAEICRQRGIKCKCIRCREAGRAEKTGEPKIMVMKYPASDGAEYFISAEDENYIFGFCRLRFPNQTLRKEITKSTALIRELHVYGPAVSIGKKGRIQHKGLGKNLLKTAESIALKHGKKKIVVISGIGVREYYRKLGYKLEGVYMVKTISKKN